MKKIVSFLVALLMVTSVSAASMSERVDSYRSDYVGNKELCLETLDELACYFTIASAMQIVDKNSTVMPGPASGGTLELDIEVLEEATRSLKNNAIARAMFSQTGFDMDALLSALSNTTEKEVSDFLSAIEKVNPQLQKL